MKTTFIYISCLFLLLVQGCKLTDVTDLKPENKVDGSTVVTDIPSAEKLLAGAYYSLRAEAMGTKIPIYANLMGVNVVSTYASDAAYMNNNVSASDQTINNYVYGGPYQLIQTANFVIQKTKLLQVNDPRKEEIIAEGRFLRALGHFYILRSFSQFWDLNSPLGIEIKNQPSAAIAARATVKASYDFILSDLDEAMLRCPDYKTGVAKGYATKLSAKALKSRVLLYKRDYAGAASLAKEVMDGTAQLTDDFVTLFKEEKYNSDEAILATITFANNGGNDETGKGYYWRYGTTLSNRYIALLASDLRKKIIVKNNKDAADPLKWHGNGKFTSGVDGSFNDTEYYFRLAEAYLIYAEAEVRKPGGSLTDALDVLNALRYKRGVPEATAATKAQLLILIRTEKELELGAESGEDWFDVVRYIKNGDVQASSVKVSLTDENKLILPIPQVTVSASRKLVEQNPGY